MRQFIILLCSVWATTQLAGQEPIALRDVFETFKFYPESGPDFRFMNDGVHYSAIENGDMLRFNIFTRTSDSVLVSKKDFGRKVSGYRFSKDERFLLFWTNAESIYRHSEKADFFVLDLTTRKIDKVNRQKKARAAILSPDNQMVAFVEENNIFIKNITDGKITQVTYDGLENKVINGVTDWLYEEEFSPVNGEGMPAMAWSPDGGRLAFFRFDESRVPEMSLLWFENKMYPRETRFKYPKVGQNNSEVTIHIYNVATNTMPPVPDIKYADDDYLVRLQWASNFNLVVTRFNRAQDTLDLVLLYPDGLGKNLSYEKDLILRETDTAYVELLDNLHFLEDKQRFIWSSERSGNHHLYLYDFINGNMIRPLTEGNFDVTEFYGVDEKNGKFYFQAATPTPMDRQVWEGDLNGSSLRLLTPGKGTSNADFSPTFDLFQIQWSDANHPLLATLCDRKGKVLDTIVHNFPLKEMTDETGFVEKTFFKIPISGGDSLHAWMLRPANLPPGQKLPILMEVYGGPGSQTVLNQYDGYTGAWYQMLVQKGYAIVSVDNRGTGARGANFKKCTQMQLGKLETEDQIAAARYLRELPWADSARIGIWGWSFGGYVSTSCIFKGNDVFKMAIAVAPVTNWKWYDSSYTERYMRTGMENESGYEANSPINPAHLLKGNFLLCHGMADDNVHWQNSAELINALIHHRKSFETYYYPNRNHGIYGDHATMHLFARLTDFIQEKL